MKEYRYTLEQYGNGKNTRYPCPACHKEKSFTRYIDVATGQYVHPTVGRCDRESSCGYHYSPKKYFAEHNITQAAFLPKNRSTLNAAPCHQKTASFIPFDQFKDSLRSYDKNNFVKYLIGLFGKEVTKELISHYFLGTSNHWDGATIFWQVDITGSIKTGKIMLYSPKTGKRVKEPFNHIFWVHTAMKSPDFVVKQCFFGEHLLRDQSMPIAIVESEKTAVIASVYLPQFVWLASGGLSNLNSDKCKVLSGRKVALFPDLNGFEKWKNKAQELSYITHFTVSDLLERKGTDMQRKQGLDLADYLVSYDFREFLQKQTDPPVVYPAEKPCSLGVDSSVTNVLPEYSPEGVEELASYFKHIALPTDPVTLNQCTTLRDTALFIEVTLCWLRNHPNNPGYKTYFEQLAELKAYLECRLN